jgi:hypothetical protein
MRLIDEAPHQVSEVQVTQLTNAGAFTRPADEQDLERATAVIRDMAVPGLVEMFEESLVVAEYYLRPAFPALRLEYVPQNVGQGTPRAPVESGEYWEGVWGKELYERLVRMNEMDTELVLRAADKLAGLRSRCARLALTCEPARVPLAVVPAVEEQARVRRSAAGD